MKVLSHPVVFLSAVDLLEVLTKVQFVSLNNVTSSSAYSHHRLQSINMLRCIVTG